MRTFRFDAVGRIAESERYLTISTQRASSRRLRVILLSRPTTEVSRRDNLQLQKFSISLMTESEKVQLITVAL